MCICVYTYVPVRCFVTYLIANNLYLVLFFLLALLSPVPKEHVNNKMAKNTNRTAKESLNMTDDAMCVCVHVCVLNLIHTPSLYISTYTYVHTYA